MRVKHSLARLLPLLIVLLTGGALTTEQGSEISAIRFAPLPMEDREAMMRQYLGFMDFLEQGLGTPFEMVHEHSDEGLIDAFARGEIDLALLGPLPYIALTQRMPAAIALARFIEPNGSVNSTCSLIRFGDHPVDLAGDDKKTIALTQPLATCGDFGARKLLHHEGQSLDSPRFDRSYVGNHEQVALEVIFGHADLGGIKTAIAQAYEPLGIVIIATTEPLPGFLLVGNTNTLNQQHIDRIHQLLLGLDPRLNPADQTIMQAWGPRIRHGVTEAQDADYDTIRAEWNQLNTDPMRDH